MYAHRTQSSPSRRQQALGMDLSRDVLCLNGYELFVEKEEAVRTVVGVAAGEMSEDELRQWISRFATKMA